MGKTTTADATTETRQTPDALLELLRAHGLEQQWMEFVAVEMKAGRTKPGALAAAWDKFSIVPALTEDAKFRRRAPKLEQWAKSCRAKAEQMSQFAAQLSGGGSAEVDDFGIAVYGLDDAIATAGDGTDFRSDVQWVYENFHRCVRRAQGKTTVNYAAAKTPAPSAGAIGYLKWAASHEVGFFKDVAPKFLGKEEKQGDEVVVKERKSLQECRERVAGLLAEFRASKR